MNFPLPPGSAEIGAPAPELFPEAWAVAGQWTDPVTGRLQTLVRFFATDSNGVQVGRDAFLRLFDAVEFLEFSSCPHRRSAIALEPPRESKLTREEQELVDRLLVPATAQKTPSFPARVMNYLRMLRRKANGSFRPAVSLGLSHVDLRRDGVVFLKGNLS